MPTLVIHGKEDSLINISGGRATAEEIPEAQLEEIDGMGHDLPEHTWMKITDFIEENTKRADVSVGTCS